MEASVLAVCATQQAGRGRRAVGGGQRAEGGGQQAEEGGGQQTEGSDQRQPAVLCQWRRGGAWRAARGAPILPSTSGGYGPGDGSVLRSAVDETSIILLQPPLPLVGVSIVMERERQQNDRSLVIGYLRKFWCTSLRLAGDDRSTGPITAAIPPTVAAARPSCNGCCAAGVRESFGSELIRAIMPRIVCICGMDYCTCSECAYLAIRRDCHFELTPPLRLYWNAY